MSYRYYTSDEHLCFWKFSTTDPNDAWILTKIDVEWKKCTFSYPGLTPEYSLVNSSIVLDLRLIDFPKKEQYRYLTIDLGRIWKFGIADNVGQAYTRFNASTWNDISDYPDLWPSQNSLSKTAIEYPSQYRNLRAISYAEGEGVRRTPLIMFENEVDCGLSVLAV